MKIQRIQELERRSTERAQGKVIRVLTLSGSTRYLPYTLESEKV